MALTSADCLKRNKIQETASVWADAVFLCKSFVTEIMFKTVIQITNSSGGDNFKRMSFYKKRMHKLDKIYKKRCEKVIVIECFQNK